MERRLRALLDAAPGPVPWYPDMLPAFRSGDRTWSWRPERVDGDGSGWPVLQSDGDGVVRFVPGWYTYAVDAGSGRLLVWRSRLSGAIELRLHRVDALAPVVFSRPEPKAGDRSGGRALELVRIPRLGAGMWDGYGSRTPIACEELLLLAHRPPSSDDDPALAVVSWTPASGRVEVRLQTWFTAATHDLGYEWVTRVARDPTTGRIVGEGIRIPPFELGDDGTTLRRLLRA